MIILIYRGNTVRDFTVGAEGILGARGGSLTAAAVGSCVSCTAWLANTESRAFETLDVSAERDREDPTVLFNDVRLIVSNIENPPMVGVVCNGLLTALLGSDWSAVSGVESVLILPAVRGNNLK